MYLLYALSLCALTVPFSLTAQLSWSGGMALGPNFSNIRHDNSILDSEVKTGFSLGLRVACHPHDRLVIQAEALIERKGSQLETTLTDIEGNPISDHAIARNHFDYLVFPLTVQWRFGKGRFRHGPYAGAYVAKLIRQTFVFPLEGGNFKEDHTDFFQESDAGILAGLGANWAIDEVISFNLEARYSIGWRNFQRPTTSVDRTWHRSVALLAGLHFNLGQ